jgi:ribonuclease BN (tRNA processing enzyme)
MTNRIALLLLLCGAGPLAAQHADSPATRLVLLGTGTPNADPDRSGPALAVVVNGTAYLVDAGPGIVRRAEAARRRHQIEALAPRNLGIVFITHLHSDHTLGLPDLLYTGWTLEREAPLRVFGPPGTARMMRGIQDAWREDVRIRIDGLEPANRSGHRASVREIRPGIVYRDSNVTVRAVAVPHGEWRYAYAYRFETRERVIVISGDTSPSDAIVEACNGCDILVHEAFSEAGWERREPEWQRYHRAVHTSASDLGRIAARARPGLLVLYHQLPWSATTDSMVEEVRRHFSGRVVSGSDLDIY